jgi:hypothetical protein
MRQIWDHPLSREILLVLIVKIAIIFAIWWVFFRDPENAPPPTPEQVSRALLETSHANDNHKE